MWHFIDENTKLSFQSCAINSVPMACYRMGVAPFALAGKETSVERVFRYKSSLNCMQTLSRYGP
jgi:hypothetical protein